MLRCGQVSYARTSGIALYMCNRKEAACSPPHCHDMQPRKKEEEENWIQYTVVTLTVFAIEIKTWESLL